MLAPKHAILDEEPGTMRSSDVADGLCGMSQGELVEVANTCPPALLQILQNVNVVCLSRQIAAAMPLPTLLVSWAGTRPKSKTFKKFLFWAVTWFLHQQSLAVFFFGIPSPLLLQVLWQLPKLVATLSFTQDASFGVCASPSEDTVLEPDGYRRSRWFF